MVGRKRRSNKLETKELLDPETRVNLLARLGVEQISETCDAEATGVVGEDIPSFMNEPLGPEMTTGLA